MPIYQVIDILSPEQEDPSRQETGCNKNIDVEFLTTSMTGIIKKERLLDGLLTRNINHEVMVPWGMVYLPNLACRLASKREYIILNHK